jgi:fumarate hydratase class II
MVCAQVMGNHQTLTFAASQGQFELNVFKPVIGYNVLQSIRLLSDAMCSFRLRCVDGIEANLERIDELVRRSLMLVTALAPGMGYDQAAAIAKKAHQNGTTLREEALATGMITGDEFDRLVDPAKMV